MRVLHSYFGLSQNGFFTMEPEALTNDVILNLLNTSGRWKATEGDKDVLEGRDCVRGTAKRG